MTGVPAMVATARSVAVGRHARERARACRSRTQRGRLAASPVRDALAAADVGKVWSVEAAERFGVGPAAGLSARVRVGAVPLGFAADAGGQRRRRCGTSPRSSTSWTPRGLAGALASAGVRAPAVRRSTPLRRRRRALRRVAPSATSCAAMPTTTAAAAATAPDTASARCHRRARCRSGAPRRLGRPLAAPWRAGVPPSARRSRAARRARRAARASAARRVRRPAPPRARRRAVVGIEAEIACGRVELAVELGGEKLVDGVGGEGARACRSWCSRF